MTTNKPEVVVVNEDKMRAEFEAWAGSKKFGLSKGHFKKDEDGEYLNFPTQCYWDVWQASRAAPAAQGEPAAWLRFRSHRVAADDVIEGLEICEPGETGDDGGPAFPVYATPQPTPDVAGLVEVLEDINQWVSRWASADHPVAKAARKALAAYRKQGGGA